MRVRALVWLRGLSWFDGERVTDEEQIAALRLSARSLVTQQAILAHAATDGTALLYCTLLDTNAHR